MSEMSKGQAQTPDPHNSVDNALTVSHNAQTKSVDNRHVSDATLWTLLDQEVTQRIKSVQGSLERMGGVYAARLVLAHIGTYWPEMYPSEQRIADTLGMSRNTVHQSIKALIQADLLKVVGKRGRGVKVYAMPLFEQSYGSVPVLEPVSVPVSEPVSEPVRYGVHQQNMNITKSKHNNPLFNLYVIAISPLTDELQPEFNKTVQNLFTKTIELKPAWETEPQKYGEALLRVMSPSVNQQGGVVDAMRTLLSQVQESALQEPARAFANLVALKQVDEPEQQPFKGLALLREVDEYLEPQQRIENWQRFLAAGLLRQVLELNPAWETDPQHIANQINDLAEYKDSKSTYKAIQQLAQLNTTKPY